MADTQSTEIFTGDEADAGPSLEEQHDALVKEGLIAPEGDTPGSEDESRVAQGGADEAKKGSNDERPAWLPEEFDTPEEFAEAYAKMQEKKGSDEEDDEVGDDEPTGPTSEERAAAEEATKKAGLDLAEVSAEWRESGELSGETYAALEAAGYPPEMVDVYIDGLVSRTNAVVYAAYDAVGGEEAYAEMIEWAADNLSPEEQAEFDAAVNSGKRSEVLRAVKALKSDFTAARKDDAQEPEDVITSKGRTAASVYESMDDYLEDLNDPRYDTNETFRAKVMAKLDRSNIM